VAKAAEFAETRKISTMVSSAPEEQEPEPEPAPKKKPARRRKAPYSKTELRELREILESERVRLLKDMDVLDARKAEAEASNRTFSNHQADAATDSSAMETMFVTRRYEEERLGQVVTALERLDKGDYGLCDMCADEPQKLCDSCPFIPIGRLRAKPFAKLCVPCREQMEKAKRR
jgi:RNA polymerase-binding transcription factor DksA